MPILKPASLRNSQILFAAAWCLNMIAPEGTKTTLTKRTNPKSLNELTKTGNNILNITEITGFEFKGSEIGNSKTFNFGDEYYNVQAYGEKIANFQDRVLRYLRLVSKEVPLIEEIYVTTSPENIMHPDQKIHDFAGYMRKSFHFQKTTMQQKRDFLNEHKEQIIFASMLGIDIGALIFSLKKVDGKITTIGAKGIKLPIIIGEKDINTYEDISDEIKKMASRIHKSPEFLEFQKELMEIILNDCGVDTQFYKDYKKNYETMRAFLDGETQTYNPENIIFKRISYIQSGEEDKELHTVAITDESKYWGKISKGLKVGHLLETQRRDDSTQDIYNKKTTSTKKNRQSTFRKKDIRKG
jgi:hypothetical protein